jgi:hypothetical protein
MYFEYADYRPVVCDTFASLLNFTHKLIRDKVDCYFLSEAVKEITCCLVIFLSDQ